MKKGIFITFEGPDGSGKTTAINEVIKYFENLNFNIVKTREPGGSELAEKIRNLILDKDNPIDKHAEALLYAASRAQHINDTIKPALDKGEVVLCDRFIDSSLAYQGVARGLGIDEVLKLSEFAIQGILPDLTIFFDIAPKDAIQRIKDNSQREVNRLDLEKLSFHEKVYSGYKKVTDMYPKRIKVIDASKDIPKVLDQVLFIIEDYLKQRSN